MAPAVWASDIAADDIAATARMEQRAAAAEQAEAAVAEDGTRSNSDRKRWRRTGKAS